MSVRALIVDDEPMARQTLRAFTADVPWLHVIGEAADGHEAVACIDRLEPDLVFLDIQMPELSGLDVLDQIGHTPFVVFTTAFDQFAVAAFELGALDYLLKPFSRERFAAALARIEGLGTDAAYPVLERAH